MIGGEEERKLEELVVEELAKGEGEEEEDIPFVVVAAFIASCFGSTWLLSEKVSSSSSSEDVSEASCSCASILALASL